MTPSVPSLLTHDEIALHARHLWQDRGCPTDQDNAIWLEAEQQLNASHHILPAPKADTVATRAQHVTPSENLSGYQLPPAATEQETILAALQKKDARTAQTPHHTGPNVRPAVTGKPIWPQPHSS